MNRQKDHINKRKKIKSKKKNKTYYKRNHSISLARRAKASKSVYWHKVITRHTISHCGGGDGGAYLESINLVYKHGAIALRLDHIYITTVCYCY